VTGLRIYVVAQVAESSVAHTDTLYLVPNRLVVQSWRSVHWPKDDLDSILTLIFSRYDDRGRVTLVHANVPDADYAGVKNGWNQYYWRRWKAYLSASRPS